MSVTVAQASHLVPAEVRDAIEAVEKAQSVQYGLLDADSRRDTLLALTRLRNQVEALDASVVAAADDPLVHAASATTGSATLTAWLVKNTNGRRGQLAGRTRRAERLRHMPLVRAAFEAGDITTDHVRLLGELTAPRFLDDFIGFEAELVEWAITLGWQEFTIAITAWKNAVDATEPDLKDETDQEAREVHLSRSWKDRGMLDGTLTPEARVIVRRELDRLCRQLLDVDRAEARSRLGRDDITSADLLRTMGQRRHDATMMMAIRSNGADPASAPGAPIVQIRASQECAEAALLRYVGLEPDPVPAERWECEFDDGTPLTYDQLARYIIQGVIYRVVVDQDGAVLDHGRGRRLFTTEQKLALAYRDRECACGCGVLAMFVDADHDLAWEDGGMTDLENAVARCRTTHTRKTADENHRRREYRRNQLTERRIEQQKMCADDVDPGEGAGRVGSRRGESALGDDPPVHGRRSSSPPFDCPLDPDREPPSPVSRTFVMIDFASRYHPGEQRF